MRFRVLGPHTINGVEPGGEFDYEDGAPAWEDHEEGVPPAFGAPYNWRAWVRSGWVEVIDDPPATGAPAKPVKGSTDDAKTEAPAA